MLNFQKNVDMAIIGENYLSYLFGIRQLKSQKSVLIVDDSDQKIECERYDVFGIMEKSFMQILGDKYNVNSLINIEEYLKPKKLVCLIDNVQIALGGTPSQNLIELGRKTPSLFNRELFLSDSGTEKFYNEFDKSFTELARRIGIHAANYTESKDYDLKSLLLHCPPSIRTIFKFFSSGVLAGQKQNILNINYLEFRNLLFLIRGKHQKILSSEFTELQLFYLFISLLSPVYLLDEKKIRNDLKANFLELGGLYKKSIINSFYFDKKCPWRFEMESIEGIISPKKLSFFEHLRHHYHLEIDRVGPIFNKIEMVFPISNQSQLFDENSLFLMTKKEFLGTEFPMIEACIKDGLIKFGLYYSKKDGQKLDFIKKRALQFVRDYINQELAYLAINLDQIKNLRDIETEILNLSYKENKVIGKTKAYLPKLASINYRTPIYKGPELKKTFYFGPAGPGELGTLSNLINISHYQC